MPLDASSLDAADFGLTPVAAPPTAAPPKAATPAPAPDADHLTGLDAGAFGLVPAAASAASPPHAAAPQMTGIGRQIALPASAIAKGAVSVLGFPGDVARSVGWLGGKEAEAQIQGNPLPTESTFPVPGSQLGALGIAPPHPIATPQAIAAAPGKEQPQAWSAHNPLDSETLLGITKRLGLTDRPDLQPQGAVESMENAAGEGVGMMAGGGVGDIARVGRLAATDLPAALNAIRESAPEVIRAVRAGVGLGLGSEAGGKVGQAVGGTPGQVVGSVVGGLAPATLGAVGGKIAGALQPIAERTLPLTAGMRARAAARSLAGAVTPDVQQQIDAAGAAMPDVRAAEAVLADPNAAAEAKAAAQATIQRLAPQSGVTVPGSHPTTFQLTGAPELGTAERGIANRAEYAPQFNALRQEQNAARVAALGSAGGSGDAAAVVPWFQDKLAQIRADEDAELGALRSNTQGAVEATGQPTTAHDAGAAVRGAVQAERAPAVAASDQAIADAQQRAAAETAALGGEPTPGAPQEHGIRMRGAAPANEAPGTGLLGSEAAERSAAQQLYDIVDPDGKLVVGGLRPLSQTGAILRGDQGTFGALPPDRAGLLSEIGAASRSDMSGPEARVFDLAAGMGNTAKFSDVRKLSRMAAGAQREIAGNLMLGPASLAYKRVGELRNEIDATLARAAGGAAEESPAVGQQLSLLARGDLGAGGFAAGRRLPLPPNAGRDLFGAARPEPAPRAALEPTIRNDQRQIAMPGMEPSAVQAQAARDAVPNVGRVPQGRANEGLFAPRATAQPELAPRASRWASASGDNFTDQIHEAPQQGHAEAGDWTRMQGQRTGHEHLAIVDNRTGQVVHAGTNSHPSGVGFEATNGADETGAYTAHHNHPNSTALSGQDVSMLANPGISHVVAHGHDGDTTVAALTPPFAAKLEAEPGIIAANQREISRAQRNAGTLADRILRPLVDNGTISTDLGNKLYNDVANRLLSASGLLDYASTMQLPGAVKKALGEQLEKLGHAPGAHDRYTGAVLASERTASLPAPDAGTALQGNARGGAGGAGSAGLFDAGQEGGFRTGGGIGGAGAEPPAGRVGEAGAAASGSPAPATETERHTPYATIPKEPERLASFLRRIGGVKDAGGDIRHMLGGAKYRPGLINNKTGVSLDEAALQAWQHGYFPEFGEERPDTNALLDALTDDLQGRPRYSHQDDAAVAAYERALQHNSEIDNLAAKYNIPTRGRTQSQFYNDVADTISLSRTAREIQDQAAAHENAYAAAEKSARAWAIMHGANVPTDEFYAQSSPRTLEDLESEYRQEAAGDTAPQLPGGHAEPGPSAADQGPVQAGGAARGSGAGLGSGSGSEGGAGRGEARAALATRPGVPAGAEQASFDADALKPNFNPEARAKLRKANAAWAALKDRFSKGSIGDALARNPRTESGFRVSTADVPSRLFVAGPKGADVADELIRKFGHDGALQLLGDYPAYSLRKDAEQLGTLSVPDYEKWAERHGPFLSKFPELQASFDNAAKARAVLDDLRSERDAIDKANPIKPGWGDAEVMERFVKPGQRGYEGAEALIRATGERPEAIAATRDYLASKLRADAEVKSGPEAGTLDRTAYRRFMKDYGPFLAHPGMGDARAAFETAGKAQEALETAAQQHRAAREAYLRSVARHFLPNESRGELGADIDPVASMGRILGRDDPGPELADLGRQTATDPVAREAVQSATVRSILRHAASNSAAGGNLEETFLKNDATQKLIGKLVGDDLRGPLRHVMTPQQMRALNDVRMDLRRSNLSISGNRAPGGGSDTALLTSAREASEHKPHIAGTLAIMESLGEAGHEALGKWGRVASMLLVPVMQAARRAGFQSVNDLRAEALLHPEKFSALLAKLPSDEVAAKSSVAAIRRQLALASGVNASQAAQDKRK